MDKLSASQCVLIGAFIHNKFIVKNAAADLGVTGQNASYVLRAANKLLPNSFFKRNDKSIYLGKSVEGVNSKYKAIAEQYVDIFNKYIAISKLSNI